MNENTKIVLTLAQLRELVTESRSAASSTEHKVNEAKTDGRDGIFHAQGLVKQGFELRRDVDVYDLDDKKSRFYALPGTDVGIVYSRKGKVTTLIPYSVDRGMNDADRNRTISGDYSEITRKLDSLIKYVKSLA